MLELFQVLDESGREKAPVPEDLGDEQLVGMMRQMLLGRHLDVKAISLQRRGKLGTYAPMSGQEAISVGSVHALDPAVDWLVPQYREQLAMLHYGLAISTYFLQRQGHPQGAKLPADTRLFPQQVALAAHLPHAVGVAWAMQLRGEAAVAVAYFGDGASSEGDFHEACNLAAVRKAPVIFMCSNNQYAISTPVSSQTAAASIADRAEGYGMAGARVDGNDVLAVYEVTRNAKAKALAGDGPTLIEAMTYRLGAHTTADDPSRYVDTDVHESWKAKDPLVRMRAWLTSRGLWDDEADSLAEKWCEAEIERAVEEVAAVGPADPLDLFAHVYGDEPLPLQRQRVAFEEALREDRA
jgi:pyruvate dehydrogenase E1 component alpha subunit